MSDITKKVVLGAVAALMLVPGCKPNQQYRNPSVSQSPSSSMSQYPASTEQGTGGSGSAQDLGTSDDRMTPQQKSDQPDLGSAKEPSDTHSLPQDSDQSGSSMKNTDTGGSGLEGTDTGSASGNGSSTSGVDSTRPTRLHDSDTSKDSQAIPHPDTLH